MDEGILSKAREWATNDYFDTEFRAEIKLLIDNNDEKELIDRFYKNLEFGTGGLRGVLGAGSNRMNVYTVRKASQGLANYLLKTNRPSDPPPSVAIAYDCRHFSDLFSRETACVLAANGIQVHLYGEMRPVPMLSFTVRELGTTAGIVVTASHNPAEYNGYKVYWSDGCQVTPPHDDGIIGEVNGIEDFAAVKWMTFEAAREQGQVQIVPESVEDAYFKKVEALALGQKDVNRNFGVVYTPLHGAGNYPVREILRRRGFEKVSIVAAQEKPDGAFPTVASPNPEEPSALKLALKEVGENDHLIVGTDPDADRIGVMVRHKDEWIKIDGNQIGQLLLAYYLEKLSECGRLPSDGVYITTIVTSDLGREIAASYGVETWETLTGFKYIGSVIRELDENQTGQFIFGTEESHGYLFDSFVRDKDAVIASMVFCEMCAELHQKGLSAIDQLDRIHRQYSYHTDSLINKVIKGHEGAEKIADIMESLRNSPPARIAGIEVVTVRDYLKMEIQDRRTGEVTGETQQPRSNVLAFYMADGSRITARPSGTEPKIKFYFNLKGTGEEALRKAKSAYEADFCQLVDRI
ncbi:MAG: phospho-sugar mutase [Deltaproteobacteria bacterium]|nr:phospho-sugar mutase [Deltaproteobacteria bacterium]